MNRWIWFALLGAAVALTAGLAAHRLASGPVGARHATPPPSDDGAPARARTIVARIEMKKQTAREVVAGRLSLLQAAAAFRDLDAQAPTGSIRAAYPGVATEDEAYCRSVLEYVEGAVPSGRADDVTRRLRDELDARLRDGTLRLPGPGEPPSARND